MPYAGISNDDVKTQVSDGNRLSQPEGCPDAIYSMMMRCWNIKPQNRPSFLELEAIYDDVYDRIQSGALDSDLKHGAMLSNVYEDIDMPRRGDDYSSRLSRADSTIRTPQEEYAVLDPAQGLFVETRKHYFVVEGLSGCVDA